MKLGNTSKQLINNLYKGRDHVELTIGLLKDGQISTIHYDEKKQKSDDKLIYPVGSIGKPFTASLLAKLISEGKVDLNAPLNTYIPDLPEQYYPSLRLLATHHSGYGLVPYSFPKMLYLLATMNQPNGILHVNPFRGFPDEAKMKEVLATKKLKEQEYKFEYCNFAFGVLGYIIGKVEGSDYFTAMEDYVQNDLGLTDTSLANSNLTGYDKKGNACQPWQWESTDIIAPAGALLSSMDDLLKFAQITFDGTRPYLAMCHEKYAEGEATFDQGLAWRLKKDSSISYHVGNAGAFSCILAMDQESKTAVAIGLNYAMVEIEELAFALLKELE